MNIQQEIAKQLELLPPKLQEQVLRFIVSLIRATPDGVRGEDLLALAGILDPVSAREMTEEECERGVT